METSRRARLVGLEIDVRQRRSLSEASGDTLKLPETLQSYLAVRKRGRGFENSDSIRRITTMPSKAISVLKSTLDYSEARQRSCGWF